MHGLNQKSKDTLHRILHDTYLDGECYAFAIAMNEGLGWDMYGLTDESGAIRHAFVKTPTGVFFDARGKTPHDKLGKPFGISSPYKLCRITAEDLKREGEPVESLIRSVKCATRLSEVV